MSRYLVLELGSGKLKGFSTINRGRVTLLKIEVETSDGWELADMLRALQEAQKPEAARR